MAEAGLSIGYADLVAAVGYSIGWGRDSAEWSADQTAQIDDMVQAGYRRFLSPPILPGERTAHVWSFLAPIATAITTTADDSDYDLPDTFGGLVETLTIEYGGINYPVRVVGEGQVRGFTEATASGMPQYAAIRPLANDGTAGQRFEMIVAPIPDAEYDIEYRYYPLRDQLSTSAPYPLGGADHAETLKESCLAMAEATMNDTQGVHAARFIDCLRASVAHDRQLMTPKTLGYVGDASTSVSPYALRHEGYAYINGILPT